MRFVVLDAETFYTDEKDERGRPYTLSSLSTEDYVRHPWFECHGAAIKWSPNSTTQWYDPKNLAYVLKEEDWSDIFLISHHANFDHLILSHHYDVHPKMSGCTLSMARLLLGNHISVSLDSVRKQFNLPPKTTPYNLFKGLHWNELSPAVQEQVADGAIDEVESIWKLFTTMGKDFPREELEVIDTTIKMFTNPVLRGDINLLAEVWQSENTRKRERLAELNVSEADLQSADRFAALLREEGIEPEMKDGKNKQIYAFAKTDQFMRDLQEHENERVQTLAEARLGVKSTILQTRAETFGWMAQRRSGYTDGTLPVYLRYCGAGTLRPSGADGGNFLNIKRGSLIRKAILAPEGFLLAPADSSQIECRVLHYLAGGPDEPVIEKFRANEDPYVDLASQFYGETIYKPKPDDPRKDEMEAKRGMGKQGRLMCLGADTKVLTNHGIKAIIAVTIEDKVWDGNEWVLHQGLIFQGEQHVVDIKGVRMTSDHLVLCGPQHWLQASCLLNESILYRALAVATANLPLRAMKLALKAACLMLCVNARAKLLNIPYIQQIFLLGKVRDAAFAPVRQQVFGLKNIMAMQMFAQIKRIGAVCSAELVRSLRAVIAKPRATITPTEAVVFESTAHGFEGENSFYRIWLNSKAGTTRNSNSIGETTIEDMFPVIYDLSLSEKISKTEDQLKISKLKLPVYDLHCAGPRNRFTVVSDAGPLIVHNCGYGAAGKQFKATAKNGLYGPPVDISLEDANAFVQLYRSSNPSICAPHSGYWAQGNKMLARLAGGEPIQWGPLLVKDHRIYIQGLPMIYDTLEYHVPDADEDCRDFERSGYWRVKTRNGWKKMWGSKLAQNICEGVSRVIVSQAMVRLKHLGYRTLNWPYDELLLLVPDDGEIEKHEQIILREMRKTPDWLPGLPLDAEVTIAKRYSK